MNAQHNIPTELPPLPGLSPAEIAAAGRAAKEFLDSPAWGAFAKAIGAQEDALTWRLKSKGGAADAAWYADIVGQLKGVGLIEPIFRGVIESGEQAEAELREVEERGQD